MDKREWEPWEVPKRQTTKGDRLPHPRRAYNERMLRRLFALFFLVSLVPLSAPAQAVTVLRPARVFDGDALHEGWAVRVAGNRIEAAGPAPSVPAAGGARRRLADAGLRRARGGQSRRGCGPRRERLRRRRSGGGPARRYPDAGPRRGTLARAAASLQRGFLERYGSGRGDPRSG